MSKKVALVTGAAGGIGYAVAEYLAGEGFQVWVTDMDMAAAERAADKIAEGVERPVPFKLDVTRQQDIDAIVGEIEQREGRIDLLVNNAGIQYVSPLEEFPVDKWKLVNDVLLVGPAMMTRACLPLMRANNHGRIINIGSIHGLVASAYKSAYVAAKHGLIGFAKVVALETAEQDITINTICPAYVKTALVEKQIANQAATHGIPEEDVINNIMLAPMPKKRFISLREICGTVGYLTSDATRNMTGQTVVLDGAWTAK